MTSDKHDFSLMSGERQFANQLHNIRGDHRNRYSYGLTQLSTPDFGLDIFCGNGYGSYMAAQSGHTMLAVDGSEEAIALANKVYSDSKLFFSHKTWPFKLPHNIFGFCFCLESVEHINEGTELVKLIAASLRPGGLLVLSTPNEIMMPFNPRQHKFHTRHYSDEETFSMIENAGLELLCWGGQSPYDIQDDGTQKLSEPNATVEPYVPGQFTVTVSKKN